jgi:hypothetical protein
LHEFLAKPQRRKGIAKTFRSPRGILTDELLDFALLETKRVAGGEQRKQSFAMIDVPIRLCDWRLCEKVNLSAR